MWTFLVGVLCCLVANLQPVLGAQCKPHELKPCAAECNGTSFDLSTAFQFPMKVEKEYTWNPCSGQKCSTDNGTSDDCAVCQDVQFSSYEVCCGKKSDPAWIWESGKMKLNSKLDGFPDWQVEYTFGASWRMAIFSFIVDDKVETPVVKFVGEDTLTYNFHVIGKCIGQQTYDCKKRS